MASTSSESTTISREGLRLLLLHEHRLGSSARKAADRINQSMGPGTVSHMTATRWFDRFKHGDYDLEDKQHPGRPPVFDLDVLKAAVEEDPRQSSWCLAERLGHSQTTVLRHLHDLGYVWKMPVWIPHELSATQLQMRSDIAVSLLSFKRTTTWLGNLVTGDEKWTLYVNYHHGRQWLKPGDSGDPTPKSDLHPKKVLLCVWWCATGVIHWELLPSNTTVTADLYCRQLDTVAAKLTGKMDRVFFLHDNARPHVAKLTRQKIQDLGWTTLPHPPYSPDMAPTDYHLFRSLSHSLDGRQFKDDDDLKSGLQTFFDQKSPDFYKQGIYDLPIRWQYIVDHNGTYFVD